MRCIYCSVRAGESSSDLSFENAKLLIDKIYHSNQKIKKLHIIFFGGEPTLSIKLIEDIINYIKNKKIPTDYSLSTNGIVNKKIIDFLKLHNFVVNLSFDGLSNTQNYLRPLSGGGKSYNIVENTIREFVKKRIVFKVRATIINDSINQMLPFLKRLYGLGVKVVHFEPLNICGRASNSNLVMPEIAHYIKEYKKCINYAAKKNMEIVNGVYDNLFSPNNDYCSSATGQKIVLTPDGLITRCYEVQEKGPEEENCFIVGQVSKKKLIIDRKREAKLEDIMAKNRNYCKNCFAKYICSGGCTVRTYRHILNPKIDLSYRCNLAKEMIADAIFRLWKQEQKIK
ncbi:radical SAM protein [Patescibacteria group bacterium]|nr:radical SAM protein [Patescibacteria group bacterium]MBU1663445.1 radical SAM protein [Patescibacteria group bacterium]MBU1934252.1 radical SAM protein [Patescibacteria group bacterium]MBU2008183.1 radical SAM protein [Patescibacteria group bacterium]MBU2233916.1 radical SAM protein [Patescibacteria group bacterium]